MEYDTDEEDIECVMLDNEGGRHWRMVFGDNDGRVDDKKAFIHAKRWDVYVNEREKIIKGGYSVEVIGSDRKKVIWEVVDDHLLEEENYHDEICVQGFNFSLFGEDKEGVCGEILIEYHYLLMSMELWTGDWNNQLK